MEPCGLVYQETMLISAVCNVCTYDVFLKKSIPFDKGNQNIRKILDAVSKLKF